MGTLNPNVSLTWRYGLFESQQVRGDCDDMGRQRMESAWREITVDLRSAWVDADRCSA
jgi:hypothetical protein